jgi:hypothetical protein
MIKVTVTRPVTPLGCVGPGGAVAGLRFTAIQSNPLEVHLNKKHSDPSNRTQTSVDQTEDSNEPERKIAQATRIVSSVSDQTTLGRLFG